MIKNLIFDFGKVLVDYDYMLVLDQVFSTHEQSVDFYNHLMAEGWNKRLDREDKPFDAIIGDMAEAMPQYADEIRSLAIAIRSLSLARLTACALCSSS